MTKSKERSSYFGKVFTEKYEIKKLTKFWNTWLMREFRCAARIRWTRRNLAEHQFNGGFCDTMNRTSLSGKTTGVAKGFINTGIYVDRQQGRGIHARAGGVKGDRGGDWLTRKQLCVMTRNTQKLAMHDDIWTGEMWNTDCTRLAKTGKRVEGAVAILREMRQEFRKQLTSVARKSDTNEGDRKLWKISNKYLWRMANESY